MKKGASISRLVLENEALRLELEPALGAGVSALSLRGPGGVFVPLWRRAPEGVAFWNELASYLLAPWCNRIAGAVFTFEGRRVALPPDWKDGTAIHGLVKDRPFEPLARSSAAARFGFDSRAHRSSPGVCAWPWPFTCTVAYALEGAALLQEVGLTNLARESMPCGIGFHPFFARALWDPRDDVVVRLEAAGRYPCEAMIPKGRPRPDAVTERLASGAPLGLLELDDVFAGSDGRMSVTWPASGVRARFECSPELGHAVVYAPIARTARGAEPLPYFCLEPVSMVNDGFSLRERGEPGTGVRVLAPGETMTVRFRMSVEQV